MARTIAEIKQSLIDAKNAQAELNNLNSPSQTAIYNLWLFITAVGISILEQLYDVFKADVEDQLLKGAVNSESWLEQQLSLFQYSDTVPQQVGLDSNFHPYYVNVDPTLRIISRRSAKTTAKGEVTIKVATGEPPGALSVPQKAALSDYLYNGVGSAGVEYVLVSNPPDRVYISGNISYDGQYAGTIQNDVIQAIRQYLKDISSTIAFDGRLRIIDLVDYIQAVPGVVDIVLDNVAIRASSTPFASKTFLIQGNLQIFSAKDIDAGYAIEEDDAGHTFADSIIFAPN